MVDTRSVAELMLKAGRRRVRISNPDKVLFPDDGITKEDLARYYAAVAPAMVVHVKDRPLNLWRWNRGIEGELVIQQAIPKGAPDWVKRGGHRIGDRIWGEPGRDTSNSCDN